MIRTEVKTNNENEQRTTIEKLTSTGYTKTSDCMWAKVFTKGNLEVVVTREW